MTRTTKLSQDRPNSIIKAAQDLFNEKGFENTSVDDIVARVGVAKGLFYYYFGSKEEIINILFDRLVDEIRASITAAMEKKGLTAVERFGELLASSRDIACRSSILVAYFIKERNQAFQLTMEKQAHGFMIDALENIIRQGVDEGTFRLSFPRETAIVINSMFNGLRYDLPEEPTYDERRKLVRAMGELTERVLGMEPGSFIIYDNFLPPTMGESHDGEDL